MKGARAKSVTFHPTGWWDEMSACGTGAHSSTFPYSFAGIGATPGCHGPWRGDTPKFQRNLAAHGRPGAGWGRRGGGLHCRHTYLRRALRGSDGVCFGFALESNLGTGGAIYLREEVEDCQVPSRRLCLSLRSGAAGPEWRWAPRARTLALGHRLEQPIASKFSSFGCHIADESERTHSHLRANGGTRETPFRAGAVSRAFERRNRSNLEAGE